MFMILILGNPKVSIPYDIAKNRLSIKRGITEGNRNE